MLDHQTYSYEVDWWSFGVIMFELLYGYQPFGGTDESIRRQIKDHKPLMFYWPTAKKSFVKKVCVRSNFVIMNFKFEYLLSFIYERT